ncbi:hypothetical protein ACLB2K_013034 [Fragaria x ananassa]
MKLNFDGFITTNHVAASFRQGARNLGNISVPTTKYATLIFRQDGLQTALRFNHLRIQVAGRRCNPHYHLCRIRSFIGEIAQLSDSFESIVFTHIYTEANFLADVVASLGHGLPNGSISSCG